MNGYLVPANAKKGTLYFNLFRGIDLIILGIGFTVSFMLLAFVHTSNFWFTLLFILPAAVAALLVFPVANYHNVLCAIQSMINFYTNRRSYKWRGWCFYEYFKDDNAKSK